MPIAIVTVVLYVIWDARGVRDTVMWLVLMYMIIGSVTGGIRVVVAQFTKKPTVTLRSRLGISWVMLTLWLLRVVFGVMPAGSSRTPSDKGE